MELKGAVAVVTGGASGLGLASAKQLLEKGGQVVIADLASSRGAAVADEPGPAASFVPADVTSEADMTAVFDAATKRGTLRALVHCAGRGGAVRLIENGGASTAMASRSRLARPGQARHRRPQRKARGQRPCASRRHASPLRLAIAALPAA